MENLNYTSLWRSLSAVYDDGEAKAIARYVLEEQFDMPLNDIYCGISLPDDRQAELSAIAERLMKKEPLQYVLGAAYFCGRKFAVGKDVLIPRPETEDLVELVLRQGESPAVLDIGTGSGCIVVSVALGNPNANVTAWDISDNALAIASANAARLGANVCFEHCDALNPPCDMEKWDIIVSNPPYICNNEREAMDGNVLDYEPHLALFVPDDNPLLFYRAITRYAHKALRQGGRIFFEINPLYVLPMEKMAREEGFLHTTVLADRYGRQRFMVIGNEPLQNI
ncbi:MAG: peptide chain release factor N(5)-glutamine methyltransferase [Prevotella sp.]|nr:peptide chain release factor N(5)-glutamine methyltransferase [Prevotella sp.]